MEIIDTNILLTGLLVFCSRICDVSIGTVRTIVTVQGRTAVAFILAIFEVTIWIVVVSTVINQVNEYPILIAFYAFGYATGNVVGILVERKLAFGITILKVLTRRAGGRIADRLRRKGQPVTCFNGEGMRGPVSELYIACRRRDLKWILAEIKKQDKKAFYIIESARDINRVLKPFHAPIGRLSSWWTATSRKPRRTEPAAFAHRLVPYVRRDLRL